MKKAFFTLFLVLFLSTGVIAENSWEIFYWNNQLNPGINVQNRIQVGPDGMLYLVEQDLTEIYETGKYLRVRSYDPGQWTGDNFGTDGWQQLGQVMTLHLPNNESHIDFAITPDNKLYIGMQDSILWYNHTDDLWESYFVENYIGGMTTDAAGDLLILQSVTENGNHRFDISKFESGSLIPVTSIEYELDWGVIIYPRTLNEANRIIVHEDTYYVSVAQASTHQNFYFKGNPDEGFTELKEHFTHLNLSSMVVSPQGDLIISYRGGASPYPLEIKKYDFDLDEWVPFDDTGLNTGFAHANQLVYDNLGRLHLTSHGEADQGFVFRYGQNGWEHLGPQNSLSLANMPQITFDSANRLYLAHGIGAITTPLIIRRLADETAGLSMKTITLDFDMSPNPAQNVLYISVAEPNTWIIITDAMGQHVYREKVEDGRAMIDLTTLGWGVYFVTMKNGQSKGVKKLVIN